jgi:hypothetical protein
MITIYEVLTIILIHWFADFLMQDEKWALGKSKNWNDLLNHTVFYSFIWIFGIMFFLSPVKSIIFAGITFVFHTATDYFTSRIVSKKFEKKEYGSAIPNTGAFTIIGIDQVLHYAQLFLTYLYLK